MFPTIHLLTLEETPDREKKALHELSKTPFQVVVHRNKKQTPGWKGCIDSHLKVFDFGEKNNAPLLWIAEDNILANFEKFSFEKYHNMFEFLKRNNWDILFVGGYILRPWDYCQKTIYPQIYETRNNNHGTVSYIISQRCYKDILKQHKTISPINIHYDIFLYRYKCYIYNPLIFQHSHNIRSNINQKSDRWRRFWFHPRMMRINSFIFFNRTYTFAICSLITFGILCILLIKSKK